MWRSEDNLQEWVLFFRRVDPRDSAQVVRLGGKSLLAEPSASPGLSVSW